MRPQVVGQGIVFVGVQQAAEMSAESAEMFAAILGGAECRRGIDVTPGSCKYEVRERIPVGANFVGMLAKVGEGTR